MKVIGHVKFLFMMTLQLAGEDSDFQVMDKLEAMYNYDLQPTLQ